MDSIKSINSVNSLTEAEKKKNTTVENKSECKTKTGDLSAQLAYLGNINKANIKKTIGANNSQENISFKGSSNSDKEIQILSDKEFEKLKKKLEKKIKRNSDLQEYIGLSILSEVNKNNILLLNKIISNDRLFNFYSLRKDTNSIVTSADTPEKVKTKCDLLDKVISDERLLNNIHFMHSLKDIIYQVNTPEDAQIKYDITDKILSDARLYNNSDFMKYSGVIVYYCDTTEKVKTKCEMIDKILSDERLYNNPDFMKEAGNIVDYCNTPEESQTRFCIIDKILSDEGLYNNPDFMKHAGNIVAYCNTPEESQAKCEMIDKILSDERLYNNPNFMKYADNVIYYACTPEQIETADKILFDERLFMNPDLMQYAIDIFYNSDSPELERITDKIFSDERLYGNPDFMKEAADIIRYCCTIDQIESICNSIDKYLSDKESSVTIKQLVMLLSQEKDEISYEDISLLNKTIGKYKTDKLSKDNTIFAAKFLPCYNKQNINEIPQAEKRDLLRKLVASNADLFNTTENLHQMFPILPKNQEEYCSLLPSIVRSIGIETNSLSDEEVESFNVSLNSLSQSLSSLSDDEFNNLDIKQEYSKDDFISDTLEKVKDLSENERQKVYDYFGFELHNNKKNQTGFSITGYPVNLNNGKKHSQITNPETKAVVEDLRGNVIRFSEKNPITCNNKEVETCLNEIISSLPELRTTIGRTQSDTHDFDVMQHSLKVMKEIVKNPEYQKLNNSDKKIMLLSSLLHDITKREGTIDKTHETEGSFDSFFIAKKFNLTSEEVIKMYTLIKNHEWLARVNKSKDEDKLTENIQSTAYDLRHDNIFDMSLIFTHADLKAVKSDNSFHDTKEGESRVDFNGNVRSFGESADYYQVMIKDAINELQKSQPILPVTKIPSSDEIKSRITNVNADGSTNIKGVYLDNGLVIIKYNEVKNWEDLGFPKGSISKGIKTVTSGGEKVDTGNIKFIAHGLDYPNQLAKFDAFSLLDSDALISVSYMERPESKYRLFRPQGILLDVDTKYIHGGGDTDSGSGKNKNIQTFKDNYIFGGYRNNDRLYISNLIKEATGMNDEEYIKFVRENSNKSFNEIEPVELREKLIKAFASINSRTRQGERAYNEMYVSNPKVTGVFAYSMDTNDSLGNPVNFLNKKSEKDNVSERTDFLKQYAIKNNLPFIIFGD